MSSSERNAKIYGAVETETFITFEGFCKKIYNTEQQEVEVFIDDKRIDTLLANQKIPKIEDTYEVFDTEGFCFTYKLPKKYIGEKHKLEFKNIDGEQLIHSPFSTIDNLDTKFNKYSFFDSIKNIDEHIYVNNNLVNCIGITILSDEVENEIFINFVIQIINNSNYILKIFTDNASKTISMIEKNLQKSKYEYLLLSTAENIIECIDIYLIDSKSGNSWNIGFALKEYLISFYINQDLFEKKINYEALAIIENDFKILDINRKIDVIDNISFYTQILKHLQLFNKRELLNKLNLLDKTLNSFRPYLL